MEPTRVAPALVSKLCARPWPIAIPCGDDHRAAVLKELIDDGIVPVLFAETDGGTELDATLDVRETALDQADFARGAGVARLVGHLVLDDVPVRMVVDVDLDTMDGWARLTIDRAQPAEAVEEGARDVWGRG